MSGVSIVQDVRIERPDNEGLLSSSSLAPTSSMQPLLFGHESDKPHHGSTSTTFSTGSTLSSSSERGTESSASSSGVATMSSTDHLPMICSHLDGTHLGSNLISLSSISGSTSSSSNPSPTLVPLHLERFDDKNSTKIDEGYVRGIFSSKTMTPSSPHELLISTSKLEPPEAGQRCNSRSSSGKNSPPSTSSPLPPSVSPLPSSVAESAKDMFCVPLRMIVSQNRRRFQSDGFNLDLTYITDRVIAMGYPADTAESLYRNNMKHIVKFLEKFHPGKYKVFNLRGQYAYDEKNFQYRVVSYEMKDHHPPRLELMAPFCREVHDHLALDHSNVVAVHCKAGKGRTGVMICAYLYYIGFFENARQIMDYYSIVRTNNNKGVTIPSQRRYVYYFAHLRDKQLNYIPLKTELVGIYLERPPRVGGRLKKGALTLRVANGDVDVFHGLDLVLSSEQCDEEEELWRKHPVSHGEDTYDARYSQPGKECISRRCYGWTVPANKRVFLEGDIRVDIMKSSHIKPIPFFSGKADKLGHIWFNTMFTCPGFCGGAYVHGDEAFPYPDKGAAIVSESKKLKSPFLEDTIAAEIMPKSSSVSEKRVPKVSTSSASVPSSPPCHKLNLSAAIQMKLANNPERGEISPSSVPAYTIAPPPTRNSSRTPSIEHRKSSKSTLKLNGVAKKLAEALESKKPLKHTDRSSAAQEAKCERWNSQDGGLFNRRGLIDATKPARNSLDCVPDCIDGSQDDDLVVRKPPGLDAHCPEETLKDLYPTGNPPRYNIEEMLKVAYKKNLINDNYNARRLSQPQEGNVIPKAEVPSVRPEIGGPFCLMRQPHEHVTTYPVMEIDRAHKNKELDTGFKIHIVTKCLDENCPGDVALAESFINVTRKKQAEKDKRKQDTMRGKKFAEQARRHKVTKQSSGVLEFDQDDIPPAENPEQLFKHDPRYSDPHLKKYFFRQRITSISKHPQFHHHCPNREFNLQKCKRDGCIQRQRLISCKTDRPLIETETLFTIDPSDGDDEDSFNNGISTTVMATASAVDVVTPAIHGRCATISTTANDVNKELDVAGSKQRSRSARCNAAPKKQSMASTNSAQSENLEDTHPTDCSWASSSTSSSCRSLGDSEDANNSESDNGTIRRPAESFSGPSR